MMTYFQELKQFPLAPVPENYPPSSITYTEKSWDGKTKYQKHCDLYSYQANIQNDILIVTVYHGNKFVHRIFLDKDKWTNQVADSDKPSHAMIYNLIYWWSADYIAVMDADDVIIDYLTSVSRWWEIRQYKKSEEGGAFHYKNAYYLIGYYQQQLRKEALEARHNRIRNEIDNAMLEIKPLTKSFINFCDRTVSKHTAYLYFNNDTHTAECSCCHKTFEISKHYKHKEVVKCPKCHTAVNAISAARWKLMNIVTESTYCAYYQMTSNGCCIRTFRIIKHLMPVNYFKQYYNNIAEYTGTYHRSVIEIEETDRDFCNYKGEVMKSFEFADFMNTGHRRWCNCGQNSGYDLLIYPGTIKNLQKKIPEIRYIPFAQITSYKTQNPISMIRKAINYPFVEYTWKLGLKTLTSQLLHRGYYSEEKIFKPDGKNIFEVLGTCKQDIKLLAEIDITISGLSKYQNLKNSNQFSNDILKKILLYDFSEQDIKEIIKYSTISKALNYFEKQHKINYLSETGKNPPSKDEDNYDKIFYVGRDWLDYIGECIKLEYNINDETVLFPKCLSAAHQRTTGIVRILQEKKRIDKCRKQVKERFKALSKYMFKDKNYIIRAIESPEEIIREGAVLSHCVGGYLERHAEGRLNIFVIRQMDKPEIPFYTLELSTKLEIVQTRGLRNKSATPELEKFLSKWKDKLKALKQKEERVRVTA